MALLVLASNSILCRSALADPVPTEPAQSAAAKKTSAVTAPVATGPEKAVRFSPLAAKPNSISGRVAFENGQPIPKFQVSYAGMSGKFDPLFENHLGGPQARETSTGHGGMAGVNGQYTIHGTGDLLVTGVYALVQFRFDNMNWGLPAWPTDNISDGSGVATNDLYRGHTGKGIVRDFVLRMSGIKNGYDLAKCPDHATHSKPTPSYAYYGGTIVLESGVDNTDGKAKFGVNLTTIYPAGSIITVTLTPTGSRVDGLPARTITRACPLDISLALYGIPFAIYTAKATLTEPGGAVHNLKLCLHPLLFQPEWGSSVPIKWQPLQYGTNDVIIPVTIGAAAE